MLMMMDHEFQKQNMKVYLDHFIKLTKGEEKQNQVLAWDFQFLQILLDLMEEI